MKYNWEVERALLGGLLIDATLLGEVAERVKAEDFHRPQHGRLFALMQELTERGVTVDVVTVIDDINRRDAMEEYGGVAYVSALPQACASVEGVLSYADSIREHAVRRNLVLATARIAEEVKTGEKDLPALLDSAERTIFEITQLSASQDWHALGPVLDEQFMAIQERARHAGEVTGVPTGFVDLDRMLAGLQRSDLIVLAARPAMGKTSFALNIATSAAARGNVAVGVFSLEMSRQQLATRLLCAEARVDAQKVRTGRFDPHDDWRRLTEGMERLHPLPIEIDDTPGLTITQLRSKARRLRSKHPNLGLLVVDYLQLMQGSGGAKESRENAISNISRGLKILAKELDIPVIALSQLNRSLESRTDKRPLPSDLRESGAIEQDADIILFIYRDEVYHPDTPDKGLAEIIVAKHRAGPTGKVKLAFLGEYTLFQNYAGADDVAGGYV